MTSSQTTLITAGRDHAGFASVNPPTYRASTILFESFNAFEDAYYGRAPKGLGYGRQGNPTTHALSDMLSQLIHADYTLLTPSGLLAITTSLLAFVKAGDHILVADSVYGPTRAFCEHTLKKMGVETTFYDPEITKQDVATLFKQNTTLIFMEAPGSMTFEMQDVRGLCEVAHQHGCVTMMDYTWATPLYIKPFDLGVDIAIQAVTKYPAGHSDVVMGAVSTKQAHKQIIAKTSLQLGNYVTGDECTLVLRGIRTMKARLDTQVRHTHEVIAYLKDQPEIAEILYPAMEGARGHALWKSQMSGACALFAVALRPDITRAQAEAFANSLQYFGMGFSWGGYESLMIPYRPQECRTATQQRWEKEQWLMRFHIGLEDPQDLIADLQKGFNALRNI
jgi:cysteine-S-conjugate beta-lyase